jgi:site-specific recombinase XerC
MNTQLTVYHDPLAVIDRAAHLAESTRDQYKKAVANYLDAGGRLGDAQALVRYAETLPASGRAFLKAAVRLLTDGMATSLKGRATPDTVDAVQAALYRIEALQEAIPTRQPRGHKAHTWLNQAQVKTLLATCEDGIVDQRDRLVLGLLVGAGLRRAELVKLRFDQVKLQPMGDRFRTVLEVQGKGAKDRAVPISDPLANAIDEWGKRVEHQGRIARSLGRGRRIADRMSAVAIFNVVQKRGAMMGKPNLAPHDLRRTYAQLGYEAGIPITQISKLLGHANVATTQRYLNLELDLEVTVSDFIPF